MRIKIHRGIDQIGGCITEIATNTTRFMIDLGQNLPDGEGIVHDELANRESVEKLTEGIDAIFYTHYHGDHLGLFHLVPDTVPQYIGSVAKRVVLCKYKRLSYIKDRKELSTQEISRIENMNIFDLKQVIEIGDIRIIPYFVSHSAYDAYMFLVEADGKRILHTGDFRCHGFLGKGLIPTIEKYILTEGKVDLLITEGTMLSRLDERVRHENDLKLKAIFLMHQYKYVFVMCSSTDLERLASFYNANKKIGGRPFVCDDYQKSVLEIFSEIAGEKCSCFKFVKPYSFSDKNIKLISWMQDKGFCMLVRSTDKFNDYLDYLEEQIDLNNSILIYSMWKEYINPESKHAIKRYLDFISRFPIVKQIHTSGHASADCLAKVCNLVNPTLGIIPIHSEHSADYQKLPITEDLKSKIITESKTLNDITIEIRR
ncbi:MBL fold metallo-hydrolase [Candidatus Dojkabacteria bacterium]|nr:MBL fold metallo-hydrolase [Candidatus Dojkabacteria bacterium]